MPTSSPKTNSTNLLLFLKKTTADKVLMPKPLNGMKMQLTTNKVVFNSKDKPLELKLEMLDKKSLTQLTD
jgi:hypothetical protein